MAKRALLVAAILFAIPGLYLADRGAALSGNTCMRDWSFTLASGTALNPSPALQVGHYDEVSGKSGNIARPRMSQEFQVPEPSMLAILGAGLIAAALIVRSGLKTRANRSDRS